MENTKIKEMAMKRYGELNDRFDERMTELRKIDFIAWNPSKNSFILKNIQKETEFNGSFIMFAEEILFQYHIVRLHEQQAETIEMLKKIKEGSK